MYDQLEAELVQALKAQAGSIPAGAAAELRAFDYHPRTTRPGWRAASAVAGAAATTGAVVSAVVLGGSQAAFAGWTPAPTPASAPPATTSALACQSQLATSPLAATATGTGWTTLDTDVRGLFTTVLYEDGDVDATCFAGPSFTVSERQFAHWRLDQRLWLGRSARLGQVAGSAGGPGSAGRARLGGWARLGRWARARQVRPGLGMGPARPVSLARQAGPARQVAPGGAAALLFR